MQSQSDLLKLGIADQTHRATVMTEATARAHTVHVEIEAVAVGVVGTLYLSDLTQGNNPPIAFVVGNKDGL